jgi:serine/threonine protein kinase
MTQLGKYTLHEELGHGGFASVFRATHDTLGNPVALKLLSPALAGDKNARLRFIQEAQTASALEHPNIVRILDLDDDNEQVFIAMEYYPGGDLHQRILKNGMPGTKDSLRMLKQLAAALDYAHSQGVLHRDVKPGNILLGEDGSAHLCDFGLVRVTEAPHLTQLGSVVGTAAYTSPEQAESKTLDGRSDQYSLAVVAYELLVGRLPFQGDTNTATALMHVTRTPPDPLSLNPELSAELSAALLKGLAKEPEKRYPTCKEFVQALENALESSQRRRYRELLAEARAHLAEGKFEETRQSMDAARRLLLDRPDMQDALAELESARKAAENYEKVQRDWETARQKAQDVLEAFPDYPDPHGTFTGLELRKAPFKLPPIPELTRQLGLGLVLGLPALALMLFLAYRWIIVLPPAR